MKNILLLTSVYPATDFSKDTTPVVHYFAREWVKKGYNVEVIHNEKYFPRITYFVINIFRKVISKYYKFIFPTKCYSEEKHYSSEGVNIHRLPIFKMSPFSLFSNKTLSLQLERIKKLMISLSFSPDVVIGHWANPQLFLIRELGKYYNVPTCMVLHNDVEIIYRIYGTHAAQIVKSIDIWGFRSNKIKNRFENLFGKINTSFFCYSGIPASNINPPRRIFKNGIRNFLFVGLFISRKYPTVLIKAINNAFYGEDFHITFIGEGREKKNIEHLARKLNIRDKVSLPGRLPRSEVFKMMKASDCFIMVSKPETFGLVYLEAMSMGCITIGSKGEGIDGVIEHGINGFLSEAGNDKKLAELLKKISTMPEKDLISISENAIHTTWQLTDENVAKQYIESVTAIKSI